MEWQEKESRLRDFFGLSTQIDMLDAGCRVPGMSEETIDNLTRFNMEWHIIPSAGVVAFDDRYIERLYPMRSRDFGRATHLSAKSYQSALSAGHRRHQGQVIAVEATRKPRYLPGNRQFYGTPYGFDATADPFAPYIGRAGFLTGTRYAHNYLSLREFIDVVNRDWRSRGVMPDGFRLTICPPAVFNLVGTVLHPEWSETESLELGFYRDEHGNATCYAVGSNAPGDFSYIHEVETDSDWTLLGFRTALVAR
jgi:hypothetical protein